MTRFIDIDADDDDDAGDNRRGSTGMRGAVKDALTSAYDINASAITVSTLGSYVILEGYVLYPGDMDRAVEIAEEVVGRGRVRSRLSRR